MAVTGRRPDAVRVAAEKVRAAGAKEVLELIIDVVNPEHLSAAVTAAHTDMHALRLFKRIFPEWSYALFGWMYANRMWRFKH